MSSEQLSKWCFSPRDVWSMDSLEMDGALNLKKKTGSFENDKDTKDTGSVSISDTPMEAEGPPENGPVSPREWELYKRDILNRTESRNGRDHQRFATDAQTGQLYRLTTGCVPIMNDGRILLVSSSKKEEWILPKGGWESDETLEVSALRETYEEGGILGMIGPRLSPIDFETRKAKKRRLELESIKKKFEIANASTVQQQQQQQQQQTETTASSNVSVHSNVSSIHYQSEDDHINGSSHTRDGQGESQPMTVTDAKASPLSKECLATKIRNELNSKRNIDRHDDSASIASSELSSGCTHVRLSMFPLYVLEVRENWPESGRARKVVDIDTAIEIMTPRPEFHQVLSEVKQKGYHVKPHHQSPNSRKNNYKLPQSSGAVESASSKESII